VPAVARTVFHRNRRACAVAARHGRHLASAAAGGGSRFPNRGSACKPICRGDKRVGNAERRSGSGTETTAGRHPASAGPKLSKSELRRSKYRASVWRAGTLFHPTPALWPHLQPARRIAAASRHRGAASSRRGDRAESAGGYRRAGQNRPTMAVKSKHSRDVGQARRACRARPGSCLDRKHNLHDPLELDLDVLGERHLFPQNCPQLGVEQQPSPQTVAAPTVLGREHGG